MAEKPSEAFAAELLRLQDAYCERLPQEITELTGLVDGLLGGGELRPTLNILHQRLHKLSGSGGTFGLPALSAQARAWEETLRGWIAGDLTAPDLAGLTRLRDGIAALILTLDQREMTMGGGRDAAVPGAGSTGRLVHAWLAEGDDPLKGALTHLLGQFGYTVRCHDRLGHAETALGNEHPDIIIMDALFAEHAGLTPEALRRHAVFSSLECPLLFISDHGDFPARILAARLGASGFLLKPIDIPRLVDRIEHTLEARFMAPCRVLIVDDDIELANHFRIVLESVGMEVEVLSQPEAIIDRVSAFHPELVLMDMNMPGYSGQELATVIRHHDEWIGLPIVYLSAETDIDKQFQAMGHGADDFLTKPITDAHLITAVKVRAIRSRQLADLMSKDSLTGLLKHSRIKEELGSEVARAKRSGRPLSVAMIDIDRFKSVNDTYGHAVGDRVIMALSRLLRQRLRKSDSIGRYGGEEFVALLPECDAATAKTVMEDIRERFSALSFTHEEKQFTCTFSAGIACVDPSWEVSGDSLLVFADEALYAAKHGGRNQVRLASMASS